MTLREAVSQIRSSFKLISSDNTITDRAIAAELRSVASLLIKREVNQRKLMSTDNIFTELSCIEMTSVPLSECASFSSNCTISRSKDKIPRFADNTYGPIVQGVFTIDKKTKFNYMDPSRYVSTLHLYKDNRPYFWRFNGYLYITNPHIKKITVIAYFEDDIDYIKYSCNSEDTCPPNPLDLEFKCPTYLINNVLSMTRETMLKTYKNSVQDLQEDDMDTAK